MRIWKFGLPPVPRAMIDMPAGATILAVAEQKGIVYVWAHVDPSAHRVARIICCYMTGDEIPEDCGEHIGTVQALGADGHPYVTHYFLEH